MRNATKWRLWERRNRRTFAPSYELVAKMLTLGRAQTSLALLSLNRIIVTVIIIHFLKYSKDMKKVMRLFFAAAVLVGLASCNSNDDFGSQAIEIPGITIDGDVDCCSAEEALQVYNFLRTVKIIPELSTTVDGKYDVFAYSRNGSFHTGYNEIFFVATKKKNGNYIKNFDVTNVTPLMLMVKMNMKHSTPVGPSVETFDETRLAVKRGWVSFLMNTSEAGSWTLGYNVSVPGP